MEIEFNKNSDFFTISNMPDKTINPEISVIIPTYNRSRLVERAVTSVINQTYKDLEIIVVDDCSTDNTEEVIRGIDDERVTFIKLESNKGAPAARNEGIKASKAQYISLLDSDDEYLPNKLELQFNKFEELPNEIGIVYCGYFILYDSDKPYGKVLPRYRGSLSDILLKHNCLGSPTPLIRKECFNVCGMFDESLPSCQDWDMWIRISHKYKFDFINEPLANVYTHGDQISTNIINKINAREILYKKYKNLVLNNPETANYLLQKLGFLYFLNGQSDKCRKYYLESIKVNPKDIDSYITLCTSLVSDKLHINRMKGNSIREANNITVYY